MKALVGAFNQEKALVGAFSVIVLMSGQWSVTPAVVRVEACSCAQCRGRCPHRRGKWCPTPGPRPTQLQLRHPRLRTRAGPRLGPRSRPQLQSRPWYSPCLPAVERLRDTEDMQCKRCKRTFARQSFHSHGEMLKVESAN